MNTRLLTIDVGNTNIVFGIFDGPDLLHHWRLSTDGRRSADEYRAMLAALALADGVKLPGDVHAVALGSVAPAVTELMAQLARGWLGIEPMIVHAGLDFGMALRVREPARVGVDRLLNASAAKARWGAPCIALDFGTATKFDVVGPDGDFLGGAIAPGLLTGVDSLARNTAQLPRIEFVAPPAPIGDDTISAMQSGIVLGSVAMVEGLLARILASLNHPRAPVIATGGLAPLILPHTDAIDHHEPTLTLDGLRLVYERNS